MGTVKIYETRRRFSDIHSTVRAVRPHLSHTSAVLALKIPQKWCDHLCPTLHVNAYCTHCVRPCYNAHLRTLPACGLCICSTQSAAGLREVGEAVDTAGEAADTEAAAAMAGAVGATEGVTTGVMTATAVAAAAAALRDVTQGEERERLSISW